MFTGGIAHIFTFIGQNFRSRRRLLVLLSFLKIVLFFTSRIVWFFLRAFCFSLILFQTLDNCTFMDLETSFFILSFFSFLRYVLQHVLSFSSRSLRCDQKRYTICCSKSANIDISFFHPQFEHWNAYFRHLFCLLFFNAHACFSILVCLA